MNYAIAGLALGLGFLANYLLWGIWTGICFPLMMAVTLLATLYHARASGKEVKASHALLALASFGFAFFVAVRGAAGLTFANASISLYFWILVSHSLATGRTLPEFGPEDYFELPFGFTLAGFRKGSAHLSETSSRFTGLTIAGNKQREIRQGILAAIPILIIFLVLMIFSDDSFERFISRIGDRLFHLFQNFRFVTLFGRAGFVLLVTTLLAGLWVFVREKRDVPRVESSPRGTGYSFISGMIVMTLVNALFFVFSVFQAKFLLGHAQGYLSQITNRENFYVMMVLGILAFLGLCVLESNLQRTSQRQQQFYHLNVILSACFSLIVMASAYYRFMLYEESWGFTIRRFYAHSFVPYFALFYVLLTVKIFRRWPRTVFLNGMMALTTGLFLFWNVLNPHAFVAKKNLELREGVVPPVYLESLSYDAVPVFVDALEATGRLESPIHYFLRVQKDILRRDDVSSWKGFHWAKWNSREALQRYESRVGVSFAQVGTLQSSNVSSWIGFLFCVFLGLCLVALVGSVVV